MMKDDRYRQATVVIHELLAQEFGHDHAVQSASISLDARGNVRIAARVVAYLRPEDQGK